MPTPGLLPTSPLPCATHRQRHAVLLLLAGHVDGAVAHDAIVGAVLLLDALEGRGAARVGRRVEGPRVRAGRGLCGHKTSGVPCVWACGPCRRGFVDSTSSVKPSPSTLALIKRVGIKKNYVAIQRNFDENVRFNRTRVKPSSKVIVASTT